MNAEKANLLRSLGWPDRLIQVFGDETIPEPIREAVAIQELAPRTQDTQDVEISDPKQSSGSDVMLIDT